MLQNINSFLFGIIAIFLIECKFFYISPKNLYEQLSTRLREHGILTLISKLISVKINMDANIIKKDADFS